MVHHQLLTRFAKAFPHLKWGRRFAATGTSAPERGLRPVRAVLGRVENIPKSRNSTLPPSRSCSVIEPKKSSMTFASSTRERWGWSADNFSTSSDKCSRYPQGDLVRMECLNEMDKGANAEVKFHILIFNCP